MSEPESISEARRWLRYAQEDLIAAAAMLAQPSIAPRHICWLAQQSVEKALKAALIYLQTEFPRRHDLDMLRNLLPDGWRVKTEQPDLAEMTEWAVEARYPGGWPEATTVDARRAVEQANDVWALMSVDLGRHGLDIENSG